MYVTLASTVAFPEGLADLAFPLDFVRTKNYDALAGVLLSLTGCEAVL